MMSITAPQPATTPIPVQLSEPEFEAFILPHLSMPKRGPKCKLGYYRVFNLILRVLYTGMQWQCLPIPNDTQGKPAIHYTTVYKVFARPSNNIAVIECQIQLLYIASSSILNSFLQCFGQFCLRSRHARPSLLRLRYQRQPQREELHATAPKCAEASQSNQETTIQVCHASVGAYAHAPWTRHFS